MNLGVLGEDVVQQQRLALKQGLMALFESPGASKKRQQPRPAAQLRTHLELKEERRRENEKESVIH